MALGGVACLVGRLVMALDERDAALAECQAAMRRRDLLLVEHRHRMRGDLQAISSLLRLRAGRVTDPAAKAALNEAAGHTVALGRIHTRLERALHGDDEAATVDAGEFVRGVAADMSPPVLATSGVRERLSTDRAVALGLLICELIAEAKRDGAETLGVRLSRVGPDLLLDVTDDRAAVGETDGIRQRLIGLLAGQLRGTVTRAQDGLGWAAVVRFPVAAPVLSPNNVGGVTAK